MSLLSRFSYGVCHYPEHWGEAQMEADFTRIREVGFDVVRLGEGAWSYFEPREGQYRFAIFDRALELCEKHGLRAVFGTPTYAGPAWIAANYPEVLRWNFNRVPMKHGSRRNYNYTSPKYLDLSDRICTALARHYRDHPAIVAWQLDNEFNCHMDVSYAPSDTLAFRAWLREKYGTLEALNDAWGTKFWSQTYDAWEQVDLPHPTATYLNPSQLLDESRFISDTVVRFAARQAAILREANPRWEITHNALFSNVNGPDLVRQLDFFSHDHYPLFHNGDWVAAAVGLIQARSLSSPFCIMEHQSGPGGQMEYLHRTLEPGELKRLAFQSVAHGTRALLYFNWRTCPFGSEQHWYGLQDQDGRPTRRLREAEELGREIRSAAHVFEGQVPVKVAAVVKDFDSDNNDYRVDKYLQPRGQGGQFAAWLTRRHIPVDQVWSNGSNDWSDYRLLIVPNIQMVTPPLLARLEKYVAGGGTLVITARSGIKDGNGHMLTRPYPGSLAELAGVRVAEWTTLTQPVGIDLDGMAAKFTGYAETLEAVDSKVLARHDGSYSLLATAPAVTVREAGKARVIYVGGLIEERSTGVLLDAVLRIAGVEPTLAVPEDVELVEYEKHLVMINHTRSDQAIQVGTRRSVLGPAVVSGVLTLPGNGYAVVER